MHWKGGINQSWQKENNLALVIRAIHGDDQCSRVKLAKKTGLKQATITKIVNQLIDWGLVSETESMESSFGRKPIRLMLNSGAYLLMAVRVNRDYLRVAVYDIASNLVSFRETRIDAYLGARASMDQLKAMMREAKDQAAAPILGIGVALPGPFDRRAKTITLMSGFPGWSDINIERELEEAFHVPVFLDQDANCGALAESWYGAHRLHENILYVVCDRGVGAGLVLDGRVFRGRTGFAGEIGHTSIDCFGPICECGNHGCLELYGSTRALEKEYHRVTHDLLLDTSDQRLSSKEILRLVREGNPLACNVYAKVVSYLAFGAVNVINTINPDAVVFADAIIEGGDLFLRTVLDVLKKYLMPVVFEDLVVDVSTLDGDPMLLGAGVLAFEQLLDQPTVTFGPSTNRAMSV